MPQKHLSIFLYHLDVRTLPQNFYFFFGVSTKSQGFRLIRRCFSACDKAPANVVNIIMMFRKGFPKLPICSFNVTGIIFCSGFIPEVCLHMCFILTLYTRSVLGAILLCMIQSNFLEIHAK